MAGLLSRERIVAGPGFNRWLVPPAALAIHLSIGMAYGFSVFWLPLSRGHRHHRVRALPGDMSFLQHCRHELRLEDQHAGLDVHPVLRLPRVVRRRVRRAGWSTPGPRKAGVVAAFCWGGGFLISALGVYLHQIWLLWLGSGVIGGCGLGLGYISPVSTLIKWFPDRRGMATGMAIMGFGGGAMIGAPLADILMKHFATPTSVGVLADLRDDGRDLLRRDDGRRLRLPGAARRTGSRRAGRRRPQQTQHDHHPARAREPGMEDPAVLAALGGALPQRERRHRRDRHGVADDPGDVRRPADRPARRSAAGAHRGAEGPAGHHRRGVRGAAQPVQHRRPDRLGVAVRLHRPEAHLLHLLRAGRACCTRSAPFAGRIGQRGAVRR